MVPAVRVPEESRPPVRAKPSLKPCLLSMIELNSFVLHRKKTAAKAERTNVKVAFAWRPDYGPFIPPLWQPKHLAELGGLAGEAQGLAFDLLVMLQLHLEEADHFHGDARRTANGHT